MMKTLVRRQSSLSSFRFLLPAEKLWPELPCAFVTSSFSCHESQKTNRRAFFTYGRSNCEHNRTFSVKHNPGLSSACWNCSEPKPPSDDLPFLLCQACSAVQPLNPSIDYFHIFGVERKCEIKEGDDLEGKYKAWQKKLHPDLVHSKSQKEKEFAAEQSARVIEAYRTLSNPLSRAIYILKLEGVDVNEEETVTEPELLSEIMEIREAVEESTDSKTLKELQSQMEQSLRQWFSSFANAFQRRNFEEALICIRRMTYYDRINQEIVKKL